jgi:hypothetical protein
VTPARIRAAAAHRPVWVTAVLLLAYLGLQGWAWWAGETKLRAAGLGRPAGKTHVELVLSIAPEPFHMALFQDAGRLIRVEGSSVFLMDVPPERLRGLAARSWVRAVRPWPGA